VPEIWPVLEVVEDLLPLGVDGGREGLDGAVDRDRGRAQRAELADHVADGQAGAGLGLAGDGQGREHDGQVGLDRVAGADELAVSTPTGPTVLLLCGSTFGGAGVGVLL